MIPRILFLCLFLFIQTENVNSIAVMSVDVGSEWMKIAIVSVNISNNFFLIIFILLKTMNDKF